MATTQVVHPYVTRTEGVQGGEACIVNSRVPVRAVAALWRAGQDVGEIQAAFPSVTLSQVLDAIGYYLDNPEEIEGYWARHEGARSRSVPNSYEVVKGSAGWRKAYRRK